VVIQKILWRSQLHTTLPEASLGVACLNHPPQLTTNITLESSVGRREGSVCGGAGQGITTSNSCSIAMTHNAAMRRHKRANRGVTMFT